MGVGLAADDDGVDVAVPRVGEGEDPDAVCCAYDSNAFNRLC